MEHGSIMQNMKPQVISDLGKQLITNVKLGNLSMVNELLNRGAPFSTDWLGMSAVHFAVIDNHIKMCDLLLRGGVSKDSRSKTDRTPLHFAVYYGFESIVQLLLERKCDVNARDMLKMTPLHWAVEKGLKSIARMLLKYGADVTYVSKFDKTPILMAMESGQLDLVGEFNVAKEQMKLEETVLDIVQIQTETVQAAKSIELTTEKKNSMEFTGSNDVNECNDACLLISERAKPKPNYDINYIKNSDADYVKPVFQQKKLSKDSQVGTEVLEILKNHGISMLHHDDAAASLISSALNSGRKLMLSEAGKLVLNETQFKNKTEFDNKMKYMQKKSMYAITRKNTEKKHNKKCLQVIVQNKSFNMNCRKNVQVVSADTLKKLYGDEIINSLKRLRQVKGGKQIITKITKFTRKMSDERNIDRTVYHIFNKDSSQQENFSSNTVRDTIQDELPFDIEIHTKSDAGEHNIFLEQKIKNTTNDDQNVIIQNQPAMQKKMPLMIPIIKTSKMITTNVNKKENDKVVQNEIAALKGLSITTARPNIKEKEKLVPLMDIPEICQQLYELNKQLEELKKCNHECQVKIEKLESISEKK